jgi:hypothetical protein
MENDPKLNRVRGLLDTAESLVKQGNHEAAESYRNKAIDLMTRYGIDRAMADAARNTGAPEKPEQIRIDIPDPYSRDKGGLLHHVARGLGAKSIRITGKAKYCHVIGFKSDLERVELLYTSLLLQAFGEMAKVKSEDVIPAYRWMTSGERRAARTTFNKAWLMGFSQTVGDRLFEATQRARQQYETEHSTSTALVLVDRATRVTALYEELHPDARSTPRKLSSWAGQGHGNAAGMRANIGTTGLGGRKRALTS